MTELDDNDAIMMMRKTSMKGCPVADVCSNTECVVMTTFDGRVYTCDVTDISKQQNYGRAEIFFMGGHVNTVQIVFPTSKKDDDKDINIVRVCCGGYYFLALSTEGKVYSWSRNSYGQIGNPNRKARLIQELSKYDVIQIACGDDHSLALTRDRRLFSWGSNSHGQLGVNIKGRSANHHVQKPIEIEALIGVPMQHIAAGSAHSVALSTSGSVFVWGRNTHGQLGLQQLKDVKLPVKLGYISHEKVKDISCGVHHTSFLKENGELLVYGIGVDRYPCETEQWNDSELRPGRPDGFRTFSFIQSTSRCTYLVEEINGGLYVLNHDQARQNGPSGNLQLGPLDGRSFIDVFEPESLTDWPPGRYTLDPKVWETSRPHACVSVNDEPALHDESLASIEHGTTDLVAAMGAASVSDQDDCPEEETVEDECCAFVWRGNNRRPLKSWRRMCTGQENIFIIEHDEPVSEEAHISVTPSRKIDTLSAELMQSLKDVEGGIAQESSLFQDASMVFSSSACINASFRQTGPNEVDSLNVDLKAARQAFQLISKKTKLLKRISNVVCANMCKNAPQSTSHDEALRFYLILMECPIMSKPHHTWGRRVLAAVGRLIGFLGNASPTGDPNPNLATLARWWKFEPMSFQRIITVYRVALTFLINDRTLLEKEVDHFWTYLKVLSSLNEVNLQQDILSIKTFYIPDLEKFALLHHRIWANNSRHPLAKFSLMSYPFLMNLEMKALLLESCNQIEQGNAMEYERFLLDPMYYFYSLMGLGPSPQSFLSLHINVPRDDIFGSSVREQLAGMLRFPRSKLQKPFTVSFEGEMGIDEGVLSMDFFRLVFEELLDPEKNDLFRYITELDPTHSSVWFRKDCQDTEAAEMCGLLFGLSLYNKALVPLPFPQLLYAKLLGKGPKSKMEEVAELDKEFADQMSKLMTGTGEYVIGSCYGDELELEDGRSVEITKENVHLYVDNMVRAYLVPRQFAAFQKGFNRVYNPTIMGMFRPIELESLVIGEKYFDWIALEQSTRYMMPYTSSHSTIKMFWKTFHELDDDMKRKFLVFVAGSDRVPVGGLRNLGLTIDHLPVPSDDSDVDSDVDEDRLTHLLPVGHGCDNYRNRRTLQLPMYTNHALVEDRLTVALSYYDCPFHVA